MPADRALDPASRPCRAAPTSPQPPSEEDRDQPPQPVEEADTQAVAVLPVQVAIVEGDADDRDNHCGGGSQLDPGKHSSVALNDQQADERNRAHDEGDEQAQEDPVSVRERATGESEPNADDDAAQEG